MVRQTLRFHCLTFIAAAISAECSNGVCTAYFDLQLTIYLYSANLHMLKI